MTPEGRIKTKVKKLLKRYPLYSNWPVPCGYGTPMLDCIGAVAGQCFAIETKAPGKTPTPRQQQTIAEMQAAGIKVFVIDGDDDIAKLMEWLDETRVRFSEAQDGGRSGKRGNSQSIPQRQTNDNKWGTASYSATRAGGGVPT